MYKLNFTKRADDDIKMIQKSGSKSIRTKLVTILDELEEHPATGTGQPELLKGRPNTYSRRLDQKNRVVYKIDNDIVEVLVLQALGHYDDK